MPRYEALHLLGISQVGPPKLEPFGSCSAAFGWRRIEVGGDHRRPSVANRLTVSNPTRPNPP